MEQKSCRAGLKPGMVVKDRAGKRKVVTRIEDDTVYCRPAANATEATPQGELGIPYEEFADTHFVTPDTVDLKNNAV